jgi:drug/metabolite transporter (DMT)-like permease
MRNSEHAKGVMYSVIAAFMWSILAIALKVSIQDLSSISIVWVRFSVAFIFLLVILIMMRRKLFELFRRPPLKLVIVSVALGLNYYGFMKGVELTSPSIAQVYIQLGPVLFALAGIVLFREKINSMQIIGFIIALLGLAFFYWENFKEMDNQKSYTAGVIWTILGAIAWSVYAVFQKQLTQTHSTHQLNLFIYVFCAIVVLPFVPMHEFAGISLPRWFLLIFLGVNTLVAYGAIALAFKHLDANKVSVIVTLNPVVTFIIMYFLTVFNASWIKPEHFSIATIVGASLALGGAVLVILFSKKHEG